MIILNIIVKIVLIIGNFLMVAQLIIVSYCNFWIRLATGWVPGI